MKYIVKKLSDLFLLIILLAGHSGPIFAQGNQATTNGVQTSEGLIKQYCFTCHNSQLKTAGLTLDQANIDSPQIDGPIWEKVIRRLQARSMPPQGMLRPTTDEYESIIAYLESSLDKTAESNPDPGQSVPHRLNRAEYLNGIRDLLDLDANVESLLPPDAASGHGFDNIADILTLSPLLMERYLTAAMTISDLAIGDANQNPVVETYIIAENLEQNERIDESLPFSSNGGIAIDHYYPADGEYTITVKLRRLITGLYAGQIIGFEIPRQMKVRLDGEIIREFEVGGDEVTDDHLDVNISVTAGMHTVGISFLRKRTKTEGLVTKLAGTQFGEGVGWVEIGGPHQITGIGETPSRKRIFICKPRGANDEKDCANKIISKLARTAYRRPVDSADINPLLALFNESRQDNGFDESIGMALQGILISPKFLFRIEQDSMVQGGKNVAPVSDIDLASRLAFFIWSSIPDERLLTLAESGKLKEPDILGQQVTRMLEDPRAFALIENFASQWLHVRNLDLLSPPDPVEFPDFNQNLKQAFKKEIELLFKYVIENDRSVLDFLNGDYTYLNERLARHYGIDDVYGSHFRKVTLKDSNRWGLLGKGSILTVTSYATRTSPTLRGKWVLGNILGTPPPPPPPNVPSLKENAETSKLSMRERMEMHRTNPVCASCHSLMDPLGLALENFDAIGTYRVDNKDKTPIDASGQLPNGMTFAGPAELREALWQGKEQFVRTFIERLMIYALGRNLEYYDMPAVRKVLRESAKQEFRWSSIVTQIVNSHPFQYRRSIAQ